MLEEGASSWPKNSSGTIDWETVFEAPALGLIPLVQQAHSPAALKKIAVVVIEKLYTRKDDPPKVELFLTQLNELIPDDLPADSLSRVSDAVVGVMRQVKEERIRKAVEYESSLSEIADEPAEEGQKTNRRSPEKQPPKLKPKKQANLTPWVGGVSAIAVAAGLVWFFLIREPPPPEEINKETVLIQQIKEASIGDVPKTHIYGGALSRSSEQRRLSVTAKDVPREACFNVAWGLVNRGSIVVNGLMSRRLSPTILKDLCGRKGDTATLTWMPKPTNKTTKK